MFLKLIKSPSLQFFVMLVVLLSYIMWYVGYEVSGFSLQHISETVILFNSLILLFPYWMLKPKNRKYIWIIILIVAIWALMQLWYGRIYYDIMPISSFYMLDNINILLLKSTFNLICVKDCAILLPVILSYIFYYSFFRQRLDGQEQRRNIIFSIVILCIGIMLFYIQLYIRYINNISSKDVTICKIHNLLTENYGNCYYYSTNGLIPYVVFGIYNGVISLSDTDIKVIKSFVARNNDFTKDIVANKLIEKNVIVIIVESFNSWTLDVKISGAEIMPRLNKLIEDDNVIVAKKVVPQISSGRSSDGQYMYNVGLLPLIDEVVAVKFGNTNYLSLEKLCNKENAINIICDQISFWNQGETSVSYGFGKTYDINELKKISDNENEVCDKLLFDFAKKILPKQNQPFYAQLVTLTMHQPYSRLVVPATWISESNEYTSEVRNYLEATHFFDKQLGSFIDYLKEEGLYDNSVIVIASDHNDMDKNVLEGRENATIEDKYIPFIVLNADTTLHYDKVMGQIDVFPTILDVMGVASKWRGVGNSILREPEVNSAVTKFGDIAGDSLNILVERQKQAWDVSRLLIKSRYFDKYNVNSLYD